MRDDQEFLGALDRPTHRPRTHGEGPPVYIQKH